MKHELVRTLVSIIHLQSELVYAVTCSDSQLGLLGQAHLHISLKLPRVR